MVGSTTAPAGTGNGQRAGRREWAGVAVLALPALLISMDLSVLYLAVPRLSADLKPSGTELLWLTDIYGFLLAGFLVTMGTLGDRIGRRRLLLIGAATFGAASVLAAYTTSAGMLIAARALLGVAGATLAPSTLALISNMFRDPRQRTLALAIWSASLSAGGAIGPPVGGLLLEFFWWGSVFLLAVPVMVLLLVAGPILLPEYRDPEAGRLDLASVALSMATVLPVIYGLKGIAERGLGWPAVASIVTGVVMGVTFVRRQRALANPLVDPRLFRVPAFTAALVTNTLGFFVTLGVFLFTAQYLQLVLGLSPLPAGLWEAPPLVGFILGALMAPLLVRRVRPAFVMAAGLTVGAVGFGLLTQVGVQDGLPLLVAGSVVFSLGLGPVFTLVTNMVLSAAPPEKAGAASGMAETSVEFGGALGIAVLGSVGTAVYRGRVADAVPAGVPPEGADAARDTLGGAVAVAAELPDRLGAALLEPAREAFTSGLHAVSAVSAALVVILAVAALTLLRNVALSDGSEGTGGGAGHAGGDG